MTKQLKNWKDEHMTRKEINKAMEWYLTRTVEENLQSIINEANLNGIHASFHLPIRAIMHHYYELKNKE